MSEDEMESRHDQHGASAPYGSTHDTAWSGAPAAGQGGTGAGSAPGAASVPGNGSDVTGHSGGPGHSGETGGSGIPGGSEVAGVASAAGSSGAPAGSDTAAPAWTPIQAPPPPDDGFSSVQRDALAGIEEQPGLLGQVVEVLRDIYDPEIPVNIYDLGLVYDVREVEPGRVYVRMTLTSPMCPVAESLPPEVKRRVEKVAGVRDALVDITWEPPWTPEKMSEPARLQLNFFY